MRGLRRSVPRASDSQVRARTYPHAYNAPGVGLRQPVWRVPRGTTYAARCQLVLCRPWDCPLTVDSGVDARSTWSSERSPMTAETGHRRVGPNRPARDPQSDADPQTLIPSPYCATQIPSYVRSP